MDLVYQDMLNFFDTSMGAIFDIRTRIITLSYRHISHMQVPSIIGCKDHGDASLAVNEINKMQFFLKNIMMKHIHSHSQGTNRP